MGKLIQMSVQEQYVTNDHFSEDINRAWLINLLRGGEVEITFTKRDGTERIMDCSLDPVFMPNIEKKTDRVKKDNPDVLPVVDIEIGEWRSIRWDSISSIKWGIATNA